MRYIRTSYYYYYYHAPTARCRLCNRPANVIPQQFAIILLVWKLTCVCVCICAPVHTRYQQNYHRKQITQLSKDNLRWHHVKFSQWISSEKELEVSELITTQLREFHMVSPQVVFTLLIFFTIQSYKFYLNNTAVLFCKHLILVEIKYFTTQKLQTIFWLLSQQIIPNPEDKLKYFSKQKEQ